ncbi:hypothetical protein V1477_010199 [Vespula maculifrons]|uniref:Uncharacterized protein n=1 Tax=Vespula maculifrons TaxID=7453 RepID=A0ABD2CA00_VESMC
MMDVSSIDDYFGDGPETRLIDTSSQSIGATNQFGFANTLFRTPVQRKCNRQFDYCTKLALTSPCISIDAWETCDVWENVSVAHMILLMDPQYEDMIVYLLSGTIFVVPVERTYLTEKWLQMIIRKDLTNILERIRLSSTKLVLMTVNLAPMLPRGERAKKRFPLQLAKNSKQFYLRNEADDKSFEGTTYCIYPSRAASNERLSLLAQSVAKKGEDNFSPLATPALNEYELIRRGFHPSSAKDIPRNEWIHQSELQHCEFPCRPRIKMTDGDWSETLMTSTRRFQTGKTSLRMYKWNSVFLELEALRFYDIYYGRRSRYLPETVQQIRIYQKNDEKGKRNGPHQTVFGVMEADKRKEEGVEETSFKEIRKELERFDSKMAELMPHQSSNFHYLRLTRSYM